MRIYLQAEDYIYKSVKETFSFSLKQNKTSFFMLSREDNEIKTL